MICKKCKKEDHFLELCKKLIKLADSLGLCIFCLKETLKIFSGSLYERLLFGSIKSNNCVIEEDEKNYD
jgi:hypothetical protein